MKMPSRMLRPLVAVVFLASSSACGIASPPDKVAYVRVSNGCSASVAVAVGESATSFASDGKTSLMTVLAPGDSYDLSAPFYLPLGEDLYLWAVKPGASQRGDPLAVPVKPLETHVASDGTTTYLLVVTGDLCPK
jgi:hypothetical protein